MKMPFSMSGNSNSLRYVDVSFDWLVLNSSESTAAEREPPFVQRINHVAKGPETIWLDVTLLRIVDVPSCEAQSTQSSITFGIA